MDHPCVLGLLEAWKSRGTTNAINPQVISE